MKETGIMTIDQALSEIEGRLKAQPGQENFNPAYLYKQPHEDLARLTRALRIAADTLKHYSCRSCSDPDPDTTPLCMDYKSCKAVRDIKRILNGEENWK